MAIVKDLNFVPWPREPGVERQEPIEGWFWADTAEMFSRLLNDETRVYLEVGTWCGLSAWHAARLAPRAEIICVDKWDGSGGGQYDKQTGLLSLQYTQANLWDYRDRVKLLRSDSEAGIREVAAGGYVPDVVYIDADHFVPKVRRDVLTALECFPDSVICGDDYEEVWSALGSLEHRTYGPNFWMLGPGEAGMDGQVKEA